MGASLTSCEYPSTPTPDLSPQQGAIPLAWIDGPLDGMHLSPGAYEITGHGSDLQGITQMEIAINGLPLVREPGTGTNNTLVTLRKDWNPVDPGTYVIQVRAQNSGGTWSTPATVTVWIDQVIQLPSPTAITLPTAAIIPTLTPTPEVVEAYLKNVSISPVLISQRTSCPPTAITAEVQAFDPDGIYVIALYYRLKDKRSGEVSEWFNANIARVHTDLYRSIFTPAPNGTTLNSWVTPRLERQGDSFEAFVQIQFVMHDTVGNILRSEVDSSVTLKGCAP
jgi:hypothetical protein